MLYFARVASSSSARLGAIQRYLPVWKYLIRNRLAQIAADIPRIFPYTNVQSKIGWKHTARNTITKNSMLFLLNTSLVILASAK